ncbi:hypothetical protein C8R48DRAFT_718671 [Suillus tomentosus]|nr:hypothetical protein C8R48DRAFT_718671 [Suillus tomentosus]
MPKYPSCTASWRPGMFSSHLTILWRTASSTTGERIIGKVRGFLPYIGYVTIAMNDFPQLKYALLGGLGLLAVIQRE